MRNTPAKLSPVPNQPKTPVHSVRVDGKLWRAAKAKAEAEGRTITGVIADYLKRYVSTPPRRSAGAETSQRED